MLGFKPPTLGIGVFTSVCSFSLEGEACPEPFGFAQESLVEGLALSGVEGAGMMGGITT